MKGNRMQPLATLLVFVLSALAGSAHAVRVANEAAPKESAVRAANPASATAAHADDSASLRTGVITALSTAGDRVEIQGTWLKIVEGQTRLVRRGTTITARELQPGTKVRFTLAPAAADRSTLGVVYVP